MPQSFASLHHHIVFATKHRNPSITPKLRPRLYDYIGGILRAKSCALVEIGGTANHLHLLVSMSREMTVSALLREVKGCSSKWVHETFSDAHTFGWQAGYGVFAVSFSQVDAMRRYIMRQAEHHHRMTFEQEFVELLEKHELEYDAAYLWE